MKLQLFLIYIILSFSTNTWADKGYTIILPNHPVPTEGHLKQGSHTSPSGQTFTLNSVYYMKTVNHGIPFQVRCTIHVCPVTSGKNRC